MNILNLKADLVDEVSTILNSSFSISLTETVTVPHSSDGAITFPNLDTKTQGVKVVKTTVLYVDMRRSTQLSLKHHPHTVAKLYSAFVRAITRCAKQFGGEVRGIIGDRVMILFDQKDCFTNAVYTSISIHSACKYVINAHFKHGEVTFGIGIDYGRMLATKTGIRRHGSAQQSYRSLVWLGRPANVASKLTDNANKAQETFEMTWVRVAFNSTLLGPLRYERIAPHDFVKQFGPRNTGGVIPMLNFLAEHHVEYSRAVGVGERRVWQPWPLILSVTTPADPATGTLMPIAEFLPTLPVMGDTNIETFNPSLHNRPGTNQSQCVAKDSEILCHPESTRVLSRNSLPHLAELQSHLFTSEPEADKGSSKANCTNRPSSDDFEDWIPGHCFRFHPRTDAFRWNFTPMWAVCTDGTLIPDHGTIFTDRLLNFLGHFFPQPGDTPTVGRANARATAAAQLLTNER